MLALQLLLVCQATLRPASRLGGPWRWVLFACTLTMAGFTAARGVMGAFFTELYPTFLTPHPVNVMAMLAANVSLVLGNLAVLVAWREEAEAQLHDQAFTDDMTGLPNRPCWNERAQALFDQARRHHTPLALIMLDLDRFKAINDNLGHDIGDQVLQRFGALLRANRRSSDLVARIGGEEFALLLPQTDREAALQFEQRLRAAVLEAALERPELAVNYSAGLVMLQPGDDTLTRLMVRADSALYQAKHQGRGCLQTLE
jgi:diguanylate cyclase (GGDEF)-like protein